MTNQSAFNKPKQDQQLEGSGMNLNDLPVLPFEKILGYLSLKDLIRCRGVSRRWYQTIDSFNVKSLCYLQLQNESGLTKSRLVFRKFAKNFISSSRFKRFFHTFGPTIFANLKHLCLCDLRLKRRNKVEFAQFLNSFGRLEKLILIELNAKWFQNIELTLNLPMLTSFEFDKGDEIKLILDAPRLREVTHVAHSRLNFVHAESVERLAIKGMNLVTVKKLKNLKYLYCGKLFAISSTFLAHKKQLKEIHLSSHGCIFKVFDQKRRYGLANLKVFYLGLLLDGPDDPLINSPYFYMNDYLSQLAKNPSRVTDAIPFRCELCYEQIDCVAPELQAGLLKRFIHLRTIFISSSVRDIQRFLDLLKSHSHSFVGLIFNCDQPQELFDRLPKHFALQTLRFSNTNLNLKFLFRLKTLNRLSFSCSDLELIRKLFEELEFLSEIQFFSLDRTISFEIVRRLKCFEVWPFGYKNKFVDLGGAIQFIKNTILK